MEKKLTQLWNKVDSIQESLRNIVDRVISFMEKTQMSLDNLTREVAETRSVIDSAITLIQGLRGKLADAGTDPAKLDALAKELDESQAKLAEALVANTPAENPVPDPVPEPESAPVDPSVEPSDPGPEQPVE
jgi:predicted  nucleic acid-binding Zn-ribbon protein